LSSPKHLPHCSVEGFRIDTGPLLICSLAPDLERRGLLKVLNRQNSACFSSSFSFQKKRKIYFFTNFFFRITFLFSSISPSFLSSKSRTKRQEPALTNKKALNCMDHAQEASFSPPLQIPACWRWHSFAVPSTASHLMWIKLQADNNNLARLA
jgi:hypothetical protein